MLDDLRNIESNENDYYINRKEFNDMETVTKIIYGAVSIGGKEGIKIIDNMIKKCGKETIVHHKYDYWTSPLSYSIFLREEAISLYLIELGTSR